MGFFDDIRCEYPLPLPADQGELVGLDWTKQGFQTKDLGQGMGKYCIRQDGTLWQVGSCWLREELSEPVFRGDFYGSVEFYTSVYGKKLDYRVEWVAVFVDGRVKELNLKVWEPGDNSERLKFKADYEAAQVRRERFLNSWFGRFIYPTYAWIVGTFVDILIARGLGKAAAGFSKLQALAWRLQSWLAPHGDPLRAKARWKKHDRLFSRSSVSKEEE